MSRYLKLLAGIPLALALLLPCAVSAHGIVYLVRHGEKESTGKDPELTAQGRERAQNIAAMLSRAGIGQIYSTAFRRTRQTAQPLAALLGLPVQPYDPGKQADFAAQLKAQHGNLFVVGHSNTLTELVRHLGGNPGADIQDTEYERLYQLIIDADGRVTTVLLSSLPYQPAAK